MLSRTLSAIGYSLLKVIDLFNLIFKKILCAKYISFLGLYFKRPPLVEDMWVSPSCCIFCGKIEKKYC